ncbi:MAG: LysR family transcriptional regulator [Pseudomonadales bacterium]|nr:LysR family transcriptional regulator [Pseudomonadales bacterium]
MNKFYEYQIIKEIVESGNLTQAANNLNLSRSAVSKQLSALEERLGIQLVERSTKSLVITDLGMRFYQASLPILEQVDKLEESLCHDERLEGRLSISMPPILSNSHYMDVITTFFKQYPDLTLDMRITDELEDMINQRIDFAIRVGPIKQTRLPDFVLESTPTLVFASKQYAKKVMPLAMSDLAEHPLILPSYINLSEDPTWQRLKHHFSNVHCHWVDDAGTLLQLVKRGMGIGIMLEIVAREDFNKGQLVNVMPAMDLGSNNITLISNRNKYQSRRAQTFELFMRNNISG